MSSDSKQSYEEAPYILDCYEQCHLGNLWAVANLAGIKCAPPLGAKVLELGCANGGLILPLAYSYPGTDFVGVDYAESHIQLAREYAGFLEVKNTEFLCSDILNFEPSGKFDYVIAHGVFSWVPAPVRNKLFSIAKKSLKPNGLFYVSYNTHPGWSARVTVREIAKMFTKSIDQPHEKIQRVQEGLKWFSNHQLLKGKAYGQLLQEELERAQQLPETLLLHDYLEVDNFLTSFQDFVGFAGNYGFSYLADASVATMAFETLPQELYQALREIAPEHVEQEQVIDILANRAFRCSILSHDTVERTTGIPIEQLQGLQILSQVVPVESQGKKGFKSRTAKTTIATDDPLKNKLLALITDCYPRTMSLEQLNSDLAANHSVESQKVISDFLLALFRRGLISLLDQEPKLSSELSGKPKVFTPARFVAERALNVPNAHISMVGLSDFATKLAVLCDGFKTLPELTDELIKQYDQGKFVFPEKVSNLEPAKAVETLVHGTLEEFRRHALLEGVC